MRDQAACANWSMCVGMTRNLTLSMLLAASLPAASTLADTVRLSNGDSLSGEVVGQSDESVILRHPVLGRVTLPLASVEAVEIDGEVAADPVQGERAAAVQGAEAAGGGASLPVEPAAADELPEVETGLLGTGLFVGWDSSIEAGLSGTQGNNDNLSINAGFNSDYEDEEKRWIIDLQYFLARRGEARTQNEFRAEVTRDWLLPDSRWFYFAKGTFEYDEFENWETRAGLFGGVGYEFIKREDLVFVGRFGAGVSKEFGGQEELQPEALLGAMLVRWKITDGQELSAQATLFPDLAELGEYRATGGVEYKFKIEGTDDLSLKLGIQDEYDSDPADGDANNDLKYYGAVVYDF